jgi:hypothetical protein
MDDRAYELQTVDRIIATLNGGDDGADATRDYRSIIETLGSHIQNYGGTHKAKLVLTIDFAADSKGVDVALTSKATLPKRPVLKDRLFMTEKGNALTAKDPAKGTFFEGADLGRRRAAAE